MQRRPQPFPGSAPATIRWRGKRYSLAEAGALAAQEYRLGRLDVVVEIYRLMLDKMPRVAELHNNLGAVLQLQQRYEEALASYDHAVALKPDYANAHYNRGFTLNRLGRTGAALAAYDQAVAFQPGHVEAWNNRGVVLQALRRPAEAVASYDRAIALKPDHVEAHNNRGIALMSLGDAAEAEKMFLRAAELKPDFADALFNLAGVRRCRDAHQAEVKKLRDLAGLSGISPEEREQLLFALGKLLDDCGSYDDAFAAYRQANEIRNTRVAYDAGAVTRLTDEIIEVFSAEFLAAPAANASASRTPVFIVGMPRSGTTLLAQILSSHPAVAAAGELSFISDFTARLPVLNGNGGSYPQAARHISDNLVAQFVAEYEKRLRRDSGMDVPHVIDKNPLNFRHLGLIARLFPQARIFHCTRHPLDTALSNYFQRFPLNLDYAFDLCHIGHFQREYARLMAHWRTIPSLQMMEIRYDDLVLDTEATSRRALEFLGLAWDERCRSPHLNPGSVENASHWQVRQPVYRHALDRWRHYEKHLGPLKEMLAIA
jgi:tetratricopeptide (TPR) repeat protein